MALGELGRSVLPGEEGAGRWLESWPAMLRRWLVECPRCAQVWLVVGAKGNERHVCKDCGHGFVPGHPEAGGARPAKERSGAA